MNAERSGWRYYNHAMITDTSPHEKPDLTVLNDGIIWKYGCVWGTLLLARWTSDFDCGYETKWWYVIKDTPFDIAQLNSNYRYKIRKGSKKFEVRRIDPTKYKEEMLEVQIAAFSAYPKKYRAVVKRKEFFEQLCDWKKKFQVYGAFFRESGKLCGYTLMKDHAEHSELQVQKTDPEYEKYQINAALIYKILMDYGERIKENHYICDGERSILHETHFQDYLEKYFGFRKAYCKLHIIYNPKIRWIVKLLYLFRYLLSKMDSVEIIHNINGVLKMENLREQ